MARETLRLRKPIRPQAKQIRQQDQRPPNEMSVRLLWGIHAVKRLQRVQREMDALSR